MAINVPFELAYEFEVRARAAKVFAVISDVPASARHYPKLAKLDDLGKGTFRWQLEPVGAGQFQIETVYTSQYRVDKKKKSVTWKAVPGAGNAEVNGSWTLVDQKTSTLLTLRLHGVLHLPLPALLQSVAAPLVIAENERLVEAYIDNLIRTFGGEV